MKKILCLVLCLMTALSCCVPSSAEGPIVYSYSDTSLQRYVVSSVIADNQLYMYSKASSSGEPLGAYKIGTILRVINWYVYDSTHYCYVIGPDSKIGYVNKECLTRYYDYSDNYPVFVVNSTFYESGSYRIYMYPAPSSSYDPVTTGGYVNGTKIKVIDNYCDSKYAFAVGPDNHCGFVRKEWITYESGTIRPQSESLPVSEYGGGNKTSSGSSYSGSSSSGGWSGVSSFTATASSYYYYGSSACAPSCAIDNDGFTSWDAYGEYEGAWIRLTSNTGATAFSGFRIRNGKCFNANTGSTYYYKNSRVKGYSVYIDGRYVTSGILDDTNYWQSVTFPYTVYGTNMTIFVDTVYRGTGTPAQKYGVCITEILPM